MKAKIAIVTIVGLAACHMALAQNEPAAADKSAADKPAVVASGAVIPLIQFQEVPLTTAIENLARQASLNYILDPKVGYGQVGENGQVKTSPNISIRWENLTAQQALLALLGNYGLQVVDDPKTKIARITIKDPAAPDPLQTKIIQLKFASPSNILASVQTVFTDKRSKVVADIRTSQLVVSSTEKELAEVDKLVALLDTQTKQVLIEAKILETTISPKTDKGIDWSGTLSRQSVALGNNLQTPPLVDSVNKPLATVWPKLMIDTAKGFNPGTAFLDADGVNLAISFLNSSGDTKVVSEPRMVTLDNQKASIDVGIMFPIVNTTAGTANTTGGSTVSYTNLTVNLDVTPRIAANNFIELKVLQGVLRLGPNFKSVIGGLSSDVNSFLTRKLDTTVLIPSGNTLVMGGLIQDTTGNNSTKVPLLGDIPGVGQLFRKDSKSLDRQNLTIFITPTVVKDEDFQPAKSAYLKTTGNEELTEDWSAWDSGKAKKWKSDKGSTQAFK
ncbi:MAG: hypothetical protein HOP33_08880 [Verrucomicrobia bacterium]|nr:hypothetical protein [Verrucomicrobiota bacterium]